MLTKYIILLLPGTLLLASCGKDDDDPIAPLLPAVSCGTDGARLEATFDGSAWCANASLFAADGDDVITISGINTQGISLSMELVDRSEGTHAMSSSSNNMLYTTAMGLAYLSTDEDAGMLTITSVDLDAQRIKGSFSAQLYNPLGGAPKSISGAFDLFYVE